MIQPCAVINKNTSFGWKYFLIRQFEVRMATTTGTRPARAVSATADWLRTRGLALAFGFRSHAALYAIAVATYAAGLVLGRLLGEPVTLGLAALVSTSILLAAVAVVGVWLLASLWGLWREGYQGSPTAALARSLFNDILTPGRISNGAHVLLATGVFAVGFTNLKAYIPRLNPFSWDPVLMELDRFIHFGHLPHDLLMPLFGHPLVTLCVNVVYNMWFVVLLGYVLWQGFRDPDTALRQRYLIAYLLAWTLGTLVAGTLLSSAGPCFYGRLFPGPDPYAGLMDYLAAADRVYPLWALSTQEMLWQSYVTSGGLVSGISAMPSLHVATAVLFFLCARAAGIRWLTWFTGIFAAMILLGSVLLAWHYAVDGYAGALIAVFCWWLAGLWVRHFPPLSSRPS
jgi:hypothetical protein